MVQNKGRWQSLVKNAKNIRKPYKEEKLPVIYIRVFVFGATALQWARASSFTRFLDHTQRRTTVGRNPLGE